MQTLPLQYAIFVAERLITVLISFRLCLLRFPLFLLLLLFPFPLGFFFWSFTLVPLAFLRLSLIHSLGLILILDGLLRFLSVHSITFRCGWGLNLLGRFRDAIFQWSIEVGVFCIPLRRCCLIRSSILVKLSVRLHLLLFQSDWSEAPSPRIKISFHDTTLHLGNDAMIAGR